MLPLRRLVEEFDEVEVGLDGGLPRVFEELSLPDRARLFQKLETGLSLSTACRAAGLIAECMEIYEQCRQEEECRSWLAARLGEATDT